MEEKEREHCNGKRQQLKCIELYTFCYIYANDFRMKLSKYYFVFTTTAAAAAVAVVIVEASNIGDDGSDSGCSNAVAFSLF